MSDQPQAKPSTMETLLFSLELQLKGYHDEQLEQRERQHKELLEQRERQHEELITALNNGTEAIYYVYHTLKEK